MARLVLVIGDRNTSCSSLPPWLVLRHAGIAFEERCEAAPSSVPGRVPTLLVDDVPVWDPLAICEFLAEHVPGLWPAEDRARAYARSVACEVHGGLHALRTFLPMDATSRFGPPGRLPGEVARDLARVLAIISECRVRHDAHGAFLIGDFGIADAMVAPIVSRLVTYSVPIDPVVDRYVRSVMALPAMVKWLGEAGSASEPTRSASGVDLSPTEMGPRRGLAAAYEGPRSVEATHDPVAAGPEQPSPVKPIGTGTRRRH